VQNGTVFLLPAWHHPRMSDNKTSKQSYQETLAKVRAEMAEPRVAESARSESVNASAATTKEAAKP